jgi:hypothetical protein
MPKKKRGVIPPWLRMTTLDEYTGLKRLIDSRPTPEELDEHYKHKTLETHVGIKFRQKKKDLEP